MRRLAIQTWRRNLDFWAGASLPLGLALCLFLTALFFAKPMNRMGLITLTGFLSGEVRSADRMYRRHLDGGEFLVLAGGQFGCGRLPVPDVLGNQLHLRVLILLATIVLVYTASGGLFAVAYTDAIQVLIALVGSLCLFGYIGSHYGLELATETGPFALEQLTNPGAGALVNWATLLALGARRYRGH